MFDGADDEHEDDAGDDEVAFWDDFADESCQGDQDEDYFQMGDEMYIDQQDAFLQALGTGFEGPASTAEAHDAKCAELFSSSGDEAPGHEEDMADNALNAGSAEFVSNTSCVTSNGGESGDPVSCGIATPEASPAASTLRAPAASPGSPQQSQSDEQSAAVQSVADLVDDPSIPHGLHPRNARTSRRERSASKGGLATST